MNREQLIQHAAKIATAHLAYDDANPDVEWGMPISEAIELAERDILAEAARWNSLAAIALDFKDIRPEVIREVTQWRRR